MTTRPTRRELFLMVVASAVASLAASCGRAVDAVRGAGSTARPGPRSPTSSSSAAPSSTSTSRPPSDTADESARFGAELTAFAVELYGTVAESAADGNVALSPYSVASALAMARNGARGVTASEMDAVLHSTDLDALNERFRGLEQALVARAGTRPGIAGEEVTVELATANRLFGERSTHFDPGFLERLAAAYGAALETVDYRGDPPGARARINAWVSERTRGRIPQLVPPDAVDTATRLVVTNAVYLKAPWSQPFGTDEPAPFHTLAGRDVVAETMSRVLGCRYGRGDGWQSVSVGYAEPHLAMVLLVPDTGRFREIEAALTPELVGSVVSGGEPAAVRLRLPPWRFRTHVSLADALATLGMPSAFDPERADFSGMTDEARYAITAVLHEVFIAADEKGTEAAAATGAVLGATSAPVDVVVLDVDRPFLFLLWDAPTGTPLFLGRVVDPTA